MAGKRVDGWGAPGTALLPQSLRDAWAGEALPEWIAKEFGLAIGAGAAALDESVWEVSGQNSLSDRQRNFVLNLVQSRRSEIESLPTFKLKVPYWLDLKGLPFSTRTRNCLVVGGLLGEPDQLAKVTFARLFQIPSMGVVSILEFTCLTEAALLRASTREVSQLFDELLEVVSEPWVDQVGSADPRFSDLIPPSTSATLMELMDTLTSAPDVDVSALDQLAHAVPELRRRLAAIKGQPLEQQLGEFLGALSRYEGERLKALNDRLGWNGVPPITLEEAGARLGVTRERLRQLQERINNRLKGISFAVYMPALDEALQLVMERSPLSIDAASALVRTSGLSRVDFHPESLISAAEACGRKPLIRIQTIGKKRIVSAAAVPYADSVLRIAYRQAHASGASNVGEVFAELQSTGMDAEAAVVQQVLRNFSDVEFLEEDWFCHRPANPERDRLRNTTRRMLSVASPIELSSLREGIRREYRYRGYRGMKTWSLLVPPRSVLRAYYRAHPEFMIDENELVKPVDPLDYRVELALNDAILVDVLRSSPASVLDRASLVAECARRSMNLNTLSLYLTYSPVILHIGTDIWSLRGVRVDPAAIEAVRTANALREREKRVLDHGWTPQGRLWVAARLPAINGGTFVLGIPSAIRNYLAGRQFTFADEDGISHGTVKISDEGMSYGLGSFLRQRGADEGDILVAEFDLGAGAAVMLLGDDELLDELSPET
ncbi:hypothetical protein [Roseiarcus sp.]|uniref:hypothetical protein n=1 Tax=Roseiarcus sp. TaxID=1969460 RepID=UPI003F9B1D3C